MSKEVKRYDPFGYDGLSALMHEDVLGDYVSWDDYDALRTELTEANADFVRIANEREALLAENETLRDLYKMHQQTETREMLDLRAERDALLAERDRMATALDEIGGLCRALRQGGPDPMDLEDLSNALEQAVDLAHAALQGAQP